MAFVGVIPHHRQCGRECHLGRVRLLRFRKL